MYYKILAEPLVITSEPKESANALFRTSPALVN